jgi:hypothetical protein
MIDFGYYTYLGKRRKPSPTLVFTKSGRLDRRRAVNRGWKYHNMINEYYARKMLEIAEKPLIIGSLMKK